MNDIKFVSRADSAFETLENDILSGVYEKGDILTEIKISEILGISRTPVREAVRRLEQEKLVKLASKGIVIVGLTPDDINDIYDIRIKLEGFATRKCAERLTDEELTELSDIIDLQEFYTIKNNASDINDTDSKFHDYIYTHSGSETLCGILSSLHRKVQKYRKLSVQDSQRAHLAVKEHRQIYEALASHNGELAEELTCRHIENARNNIIRNIKK